MSKPWLSAEANGRWLGTVECTACASPATYKTKRLCRRCYDRVRLHGFAVGPIIGKVTGFMCSVPGCTRAVKGYNLCSAHYSWERRNLDLSALPGHHT